MKKTSYWYRFYVGSCPVCGRKKGHKQRVYDEPKPVNIQDRYVDLSDVVTYDHCDENVYDVW